MCEIHSPCKSARHELHLSYPPFNCVVKHSLPYSVCVILAVCSNYCPKLHLQTVTDFALGDVNQILCIYSRMGNARIIFLEATD